MSNKIYPNDFAFPASESGTEEHTTFPGQRGLTIRAEFAARAMQGLLSSDNRQSVDVLNTRIYAGKAVQLADALIAELNKTGGGDKD